MSGLTITTLAQQVQVLLDKTKQQNSNLAAWLGGSATGGPNNDGRYPFVDLSGHEILVPSPASFSGMTSGPAAQASVAKVAAELARDLAQGHADRADAQRILSEAARGAAVDARNLAQEHRNHAGTHEANARYWAELAQGSGQSTSQDREIVEQLAEQVSEDAALATQKATAAEASAALAATFDPNLFDKKSDTLAASRLDGMIDPARIPVLVGQTPVVSTGGIANLTAAQQNGVKAGTLVATTNGRRWVYSGSGAKNAEASYIEQGDVTPVWSVIADKPSFYPSNITNVAGLQSALDAKSNTGHGHGIADVTNLQAALDARALIGHVHAWTTITDRPTIFPTDIANVSGLQAALDGKSNTGHAHAWTAITDRPSIFPTDIASVSGLQAALNAKGNLAGGNTWTGGQTLNGGITVKDSLTMTGSDPYFRRDSNSAAWVLAGGQGWTDTGAVIVLHGKDHATRPGHVLINGVVGAATSSLQIDGFKDIIMNRRPTFAGATPWDTSNFTPSSKVSWTDTNMDGGAYTVVRRNGDGGGFFTGRLHAYSQTATVDVWNSGMEIQEVQNVGNTQSGHAYAPALTFHWKNVAARSLFMGSDAWLYIGVQGDKGNFGNLGVNRLSSDGNELWLQKAKVTKLKIHEYGINAIGNCDVDGGVFIRSNAPTITLQDSDHRSAMIHVNSNRFYVLRGSGTNATGWESTGGGWPLEINLDNNDAYFGGQIYGGNNSWFRVRGSGNGIYWENHGGGWFMQDSSWMRVYLDKNIYTGGQMRAVDFTYPDGGRVARTTNSQSAPSGGNDGDVHIVW